MMMTHSFINHLETQTQQQPSCQVEPNATEQGVQHEHESCTSVLIQHPKFIIIEITLNLEGTVPEHMTGTILIAQYMHLLTYKTSMLQCHPSGSTTTTH